MYLLLGVVLPLNLGRPIGPDNRSPCPPARAGHRRADSFSSERRTNPAKRAWSGERELWWFDSQFTITVDRYPTGTPKREKTRVQITPQQQHWELCHLLWSFTFLGGSLTLLRSMHCLHRPMCLMTKHGGTETHDGTSYRSETCTYTFTTQSDDAIHVWLSL